MHQPAVIQSPAFETVVTAVAEFAQTEFEPRTTYHQVLPLAATPPDEKIDEVVTHRGRCHCGAVRFEVDAPAYLVAFDCNCSNCAMRRNVHFVVPKHALRFISGQGELQCYRFGSGRAKHLFCKVCGISPLYSPRSNPNGWAVTVHCIERGTIQSVEVRYFDGRHWEDTIVGSEILAFSSEHDVEQKLGSEGGVGILQKRGSEDSSAGSEKRGSEGGVEILQKRGSEGGVEILQKRGSEDSSAGSEKRGLEESVNLTPDCSNATEFEQGAVVQVTARQGSSMSFTLPNTVVLRNTEHKGRGLFAARSFQKGQLVLTEKPVLQFPRDEQFGGLQAFVALSPPTQQDLLEQLQGGSVSLHGDRSRRQKVHIQAIASEFLPTHAPSLHLKQAVAMSMILENNQFGVGNQCVVCVGASMFAHSCDPNLCSESRCIDGIPHKCFYTQCVVAPGQELAICYLPAVISFLGQLHRRSILSQERGFTCMCPLCTHGFDSTAQLPCPRCHSDSNPTTIQSTVCRELERHGAVEASWWCGQCGDWIGDDEFSPINGQPFMEAARALEKEAMWYVYQVEMKLKYDHELLADLHGRCIVVLGLQHWAVKVIDGVLIQKQAMLLREAHSDQGLLLDLARRVVQLWDWAVQCRGMARALFAWGYAIKDAGALLLEKIERRRSNRDLVCAVKRCVAEVETEFKHQRIASRCLE